MPGTLLPDLLAPVDLEPARLKAEAAAQKAALAHAEAAAAQADLAALQAAKQPAPDPYTLPAWFAQHAAGKQEAAASPNLHMLHALCLAFNSPDLVNLPASTLPSYVASRLRHMVDQAEAANAIDPALVVQLRAQLAVMDAAVAALDLQHLFTFAAAAQTFSALMGEPF